MDYLVLHMTEPFFLITGTDKLEPSVISKHFSGNRDSELAQDLFGVMDLRGLQGKRTAGFIRSSRFLCDSNISTNGVSVLATSGQSDIIPDTLQVKKRAGVSGFLRGCLGDGT